MLRPVDRRSFLQSSAAAALALAVSPLVRGAESEKFPPFKISLAQWSLHRAFRAKEKPLDALKFAEIA